MHKLIVMGVSGCGKSTLAAGVALALGCPLAEGDDFHPPESRAKMRQGVALPDSDREPWLDRLGWLIADQSGATTATCSALKRRYRDRLRAQVPGLGFVFIDISEADAAHRVGSRPHHLFPGESRGEPVRRARVAGRRARRAAGRSALAPQAQLDVVIQWLASPITSPSNEASHA